MKNICIQEEEINIIKWKRKGKIKIKHPDIQSTHF
jgi:hypothetical protein